MKWSKLFNIFNLMHWLIIERWIVNIYKWNFLRSSKYLKNWSRFLFDDYILQIKQMLKVEQNLPFHLKNLCISFRYVFWLLNIDIFLCIICGISIEMLKQTEYLWKKRNKNHKPKHYNFALKASIRNTVLYFPKTGIIGNLKPPRK